MPEKNSKEEEKLEKEETKKISIPKGIDVSNPKSDDEEKEEKKSESSIDNEGTLENKEKDSQPTEDSENPISDMKMPLSSPVKPVDPSIGVSSKEDEDENSEQSSDKDETPAVTPLESEPVISQVETQQPNPSEPAPSDTSTPAGESTSMNREVDDKKYTDSYALADEVEQEAFKKSNGGFFSRLIRLKNKKVRWVVGILALILLIILGVGTFLNSKGDNLLSKKNDSKKELETIVPSPAEEPTPTVIEVDRSSLIIQVLNGSGESGVAGTMSELLIEKGYSEDIDTGNADNYDYAETVVQIKKDKEDEFLDTLLDDLKKDYSLSSEIETLDEESEFDVVIIVGKE